MYKYTMYMYMVYCVLTYFNILNIYIVYCCAQEYTIVSLNYSKFLIRAISSDMSVTYTHILMTRVYWCALNLYITNINISISRVTE